jgi:enoyl-[acyl-carrier-protein] reductase (NADH)
MVHYGMTKTAQLAVSRGLAEEMAGSAVTVNAVLPGPTRSEGVETFLEQLAKQQGRTLAEIEAEFFRTARPSSLIRRFAEPHEVANLVIYLASPAASATTGAALRVDGGVVTSSSDGGLAIVGYHVSPEFQSISSWQRRFVARTCPNLRAESQGIVIPSSSERFS